MFLQRLRDDIQKYTEHFSNKYRFLLQTMEFYKYLHRCFNLRISIAFGF